MDYSQFMIKMKESLRERLGAEVEIEAVRVPKNNGVVMQGIALKRPGERVVPTIYTEGFYADYLEGRDMEDILEDFLGIYEQQGLAESPDMDFYGDYAKVKKKLSLKLVGREKNKAMLEEVPHKVFLDMAVIFYCLVDSPFAGTAAVIVKNAHMKNWDVSTEQLYEDALTNAERMLPGIIRSMEEMLSRMVLEADIPAWEWEEKASEDFPGLEGVEAENAKICEMPLLILTNSRRYLGAACILYRGLLAEFAKKAGKNFYILPSSVHEVILLPEDKVNRCENLLQMVAEVNKTQLAPEEVLSDAVYYFDRESGEISIYDKN